MGKSKIIKKERDIQKALGTLSWYAITSSDVNKHKGERHWRNIVATSEEDALQLFMDNIRRYDTIARNVCPEDFKAHKLPWTVN